MSLILHTENGYTWIRFSDPVDTPQEVEDQFNNLLAEERRLFEYVCDGLPSGRQYIKEHQRQYGWTDEMIAKATEFNPQSLSTPVPYFERPWWCYENSFRHAEQKGLLYVEGIGISPTGPMIHAWNSTDGTDVLDYTWPLQHLNKYFGIVYEIDWIKENWKTPGGMIGYLYKFTKENKRFDYRLV